MTTVLTERNTCADVQTDFVRLHGMEKDSPEFTRLRTSIIERCLSLADHVA